MSPWTSSPTAAPFAGAAGGDDADLDERRLDLTLAQTAPLRLQILAVTLFVTALVWRSVPAVAAIAWAACNLAGREWRAISLARLIAARDRPVAQRLRRARWETLLVGVPAGAASLFLPWLDRGSGAILTMILVSVCAGAVSTSALVPGAFAVYGISVLVPVAIAWASTLDPFGVGVAVLALMFLGVQMRFADNNMRTFEGSYRIRREHAALLRELAAARDRAEAASRAKTRFLAAASHDLRQPLHALSLHAASLAIDTRSDDAPRIAAAMSHTIGDLSALLDSLLDVSRLDAGTLRVERRAIRLDRLVRTVADGFAALASAKGLVLAVDAAEPVVVDTDPLLVERMLRNLVDNAIKYTAAGRVDVTLTRDGGQARLTVTDSGCGIASELHERVFDEFYRVDADAPGGKGLGLGLSIVRRLAELLAIDVGLDSAPGRGTSFVLRMPCADKPPVAADAGALHLPSLAGLGALVVDDRPEVRDATCTLLERLGCHVTAAGSADEAMTLLQGGADAQVALLDYRLPGGETGIDLAGRLRAVRPDLVPILVTGDTGADRLRQAADSGLPLLHKPLSAARLGAGIAAALASDPRQDESSTN